MNVSHLDRFFALVREFKQLKSRAREKQDHGDIHILIHNKFQWYLFKV